MHLNTQKHIYEHVQEHRRIAAYCTHPSTLTHMSTHTHFNTHTQSIPVKAVSTEDSIDCEVHKFQNSKVKHPLLKGRLDYFTGLSV